MSAAHAALDPAWLDAALQVARDAADRAGELIGRYYRAGCEVEIKDDRTPVTRADRESEQAIRRVLLAAYPDHAIHGEEEGHRGDSAFVWLVDPIDGTKSFVRGYPMFSTQIALMHHGELVLGVSAAVEFGEVAWARRGGGAFLSRGGAAAEALQVSTTTRLQDTALSTGNLASLARGRGWGVLGGLIPQLQRIRGYGDFWHYHLLARGSIDAVLESDLNILDIAALTVIVREAGGVVSDLDGAPVGVATRSLLAATPALHAELLPRFKDWRDA
jgi:histidinol-phosphatase